MSELDRKKRDAMAAKARFGETVSLLKISLKPEVIADTVAGGARDYLHRTSNEALRAARAQPGRAVAAGLAVALFLFRKPIGRALFTRRKPGDNDG